MSTADDTLADPLFEHHRCWRGLLHTGRPLPALRDVEGVHLPADFPPVVDAHVHVFPEHLFRALWAWFERYAWPIRYQLQAAEVIEFLLTRGISHLVALQYAHKPGMARTLNQWMADLCRTHPGVTGLATIFPGEPDALSLLEEAFALGLAGVKLQCHVQCFSPDTPAMEEIYAACAMHAKPLLMHASREPKSPAYHCDPHTLCAADKVARILQDYPHLKLCIPHLGVDEFDAYAALLERHDNLWLDTTMILADYLPYAWPRRLLTMRPERVLYGSDFPHLPYAWDRELRCLRRYRLSDATLASLLGETARALYGLPALP